MYDEYWLAHPFGGDGGEFAPDAQVVAISWSRPSMASNIRVFVRWKRGVICGSFLKSTASWAYNSCCKISRSVLLERLGPEYGKCNDFAC